MAQNAGFRDFIPEGADTGATPKAGFEDYVPPKVKKVEEVVPTVEAKEAVPAVVEPKTSKRSGRA